MASKRKTFFFGLALGSIIAFPLGINFGRNEPLWSNPFAQPDVRDRVVESVKQGTEQAIEGAKEKIHEATKPERDALKQ
jgi:hypothetical protein